jgi:hypothetical protein
MNFQGRKCKDFFEIALIVFRDYTDLFFEISPIFM